MTFDEFVLHWTSRPMHYHITYGTTGIEFARAAWNAAVKECAPPEGFEMVYVKGLDDLLGALERAERKGYLPDACYDEWATFDYKKPGRLTRS